MVKNNVQDQEEQNFRFFEPYLFKGRAMNTDTTRVLEACHELEKTMAKIYFYYFEEFKHHKKLAELWHKTAQEEENHALQFKMALSLRTDVVESTLVELSRVSNALDAVKSLLNRIQETPPTPLEALRAAINMERQLADFHLDCLASFKNDSHRKMFQAMMMADKDHLEVLEKAYLLLFDAAKESAVPSSPDKS